MLSAVQSYPLKAPL